MARLIECEDDCQDRGEKSLDGKYLRSGKYYVNNVSALRTRGSSDKSRNKLKSKLTTIKPKSCPSKYEKLSMCGRKVFLDVLDKIPSEDVIREILLRLPWSTISSLDTLCKWSLQKLLDRAFIARYLAQNPVLLGFSYVKAHHMCDAIFTTTEFVPLVAAAKYCPVYCDLLQHNLEASRTKKFYSDFFTKGIPMSLFVSSDLPMCSCDGIFLQFHIRGHLGNFISLHNPVTGQAVYLPNSPPGDMRFHNISLISYGLAIDYFSSHTAELKVVELVVMENVRGYYVVVNTFSSKTCCWQSKVHHLQPFLGKWSKMSTRGMYLKGYMYWMRPGVGVVAYDMQKELFIFRLLKIPGEPDRDLCFCQENLLLKGTTFQVNALRCVCRYLGVSEGRVCYLRVIGDSEISMWFIESGKWSRGQCFTLRCIPASLVCGRILSVDPQDCKLLYIRLKTKIFSYHLERHEVKEIHTILYGVENDGPDDPTCIPPILAYETPRLPASLAVHDCFKNLFGSFLCSKDTCWGDACRRFMVHPDVHVHIPSVAQSTGSHGNEWPFWFGSENDTDWKAGYYRFINEHENLTL